MKYSYIVLLLLLAITGFVFIKEDSPQTKDAAMPQSKVVSVNNTAAVVEAEFNEIYARRIKDSDQGSIVAEPNFSSAKDPEKAAANSENTEASVPEPTKENSIATATGEFSDEINFPNKDNYCVESCDMENADITDSPKIADSAKVNAPAEGEFSDQINADVIFAQAQQKDPELQLEARLVDVPANSSPPTEMGVYSPPQ